jgi:TolB-like protein/DNA-binding winged helix-turn-helix (wHTH) protein/Flp pilus assembly protein TadD
MWLPHGSGAVRTEDMKSFLSFQLDPENHSLCRGEERLQITPKAFDVLCHLVEKAGSLVTQDELLEALWPNTYINPEVLRKYILEIRRALGDQPGKPVFIETVTKRGYRFIAPVIDQSSAQAAGPATLDGTPELPGAQATLLEQENSSNKVTMRKLAIPAVLLIVVAIAITGYYWRVRTRLKAPPSGNSSIAVLPFVDLSSGKDQEYFSDGLTEELITNLAKIPGLKVVARSSAFQFKGKNEDLRSIGQKLGVATVLEGSVRKDGDHVRITAELIKADDGFQLWSETYDRDISHIFAAQDEIARAVSGALQLRLLTGNNAAPPGGSPTTNSQAYEAYLQGQYFIARGQDKEDLEKALSYADRAIKLDVGYAPAWAQRAQVLQTLASVALIENTDGFRRARESAEKAIALDPNLATGYMALGLVQINHDWDWEGADESLKKAGMLEPGSATVLGNRAYLARNLGQLEKAIELRRAAIALDPLRANFHLALGYELFLLGRFDEAKAALQRAQELNPQLSSLHLTRGTILLLEGHELESLAEMEKETGEWEKLSGASMAYYALHRREDSDHALNKLTATHQNDCAYQIAELYAYRQETEKAFKWLDRAFQQRDPGAPDLKSSPLMRSLRGDPRYVELLKKMRLPN